MKSLDFGRYVLGGFAAAAILTGCGVSQPPIGALGAMPQSVTTQARAHRATSGDLIYKTGGSLDTSRGTPAASTPALIGITWRTPVKRQDTLVAWSMGKHGRQSPKLLSGKLGVYAGGSLAADGNVVLVAVGGSSSGRGELLKYNAVTRNKKRLRNPWGEALDIAVDKDGNVYLLGFYGTITIFRRGSSQPSEINCSQYYSWAIAVDNERDLFVEARKTSRSGNRTFEVRSGSRTCEELSIRPSSAQDIGVDPKTDDLIAVGGNEMLIYPKPYSQRTVIERKLHLMSSAGTQQFRLDATSRHIFYSDYISLDSRSREVIDEAKYPSGKFEGTYENGPNDSNGFIGGFTTIPNALPN
jgi:hypothetical protein